MPGKSPHRGQILVYQDQPLAVSTEDNDFRQFNPMKRSISTTSQHEAIMQNDSRIRVKKTSCPAARSLNTHRSSKTKHLRPQSLAFDEGMVNLHSDSWTQPDNDSSMEPEISHSEVRIRKYRSVISLSSDDTSTVLQQNMSKSVSQSPTKTSTAPKMIDVSPQYLLSSSKHAKAKEQAGSRVKELLFRRMSRTSGTEKAETVHKDSAAAVTRRSKSSSSQPKKSNLRFLNKKTDDNDDEYLLNSPIDGSEHFSASFSSTDEDE